MTASRKTFAEFFAGIGLVDEGLRASGWRCVYANDLSPRKQQMHAARNPDAAHYHLEDIRKTDAIVKRIPTPLALATASFPCVDLSLAGHYRGIREGQSSTFFAFLDVLRVMGESRPPLVMLENVAGFLSSHEGRDFASATASLGELGYSFDAFVLDACHFTPQSRPRVFVIGMAEPARPPRVAHDDWPTALPQPSSLRPARLLQALAAVEEPAVWTPLDLPAPPRRTMKLESVIDVDDAQDWWDAAAVERHHRMMSERHRLQIDRLRETGASFVGTVFRRMREGEQRAEVRFDGLAGCLRTPRGGSGRQIVVAVAKDVLRMRWMSPREYARLQGAPDFPLVAGVNQNLFGFADAVCVPAIRWIDEHVLTPLWERMKPRRSTKKHDGRA